MNALVQSTKQNKNAPTSSTSSLLVQRKCACGGVSKLGGQCSECESKKLVGDNRSQIQPKLKIGQPNDKYEQEADRVANQVMAMTPNTNISGTPPRIQRLTGQATGGGETTVPTNVDRVLASSGRPMDPMLQHDMGQRLGYDFSDVRVHSGDAAQQSARDLGALAYTAGSNVVFGAGQFSPETNSGKQLLVHELTHVVQQKNNIRHQAKNSSGNIAHCETNKEGRASRIIQPLKTIQIQRKLPPFENEFNPEPEHLMGYIAPPCPEYDTSTRKGRLETLCLSNESVSRPPNCSFTSQQRKILNSGKKTAIRRAESAYKRVTSGSKGLHFARQAAQLLFDDEPPTTKEIIRVISRTRDSLKRVWFLGKTCGEKECSKGEGGYVDGKGKFPVYICCPAFFDSQSKSTHGKIIHEALHIAGVDVDLKVPEGYCKTFDCGRPCGGPHMADAWAHFIDCIGEPIRIRRNFYRKIERSVEDL